MIYNFLDICILISQTNTNLFRGVFVANMAVFGTFNHQKLVFVKKKIVHIKLRTNMGPL